MTVLEVNPINQHLILGGEVTLDYDWKVNRQEDITVLKVDGSGVISLLDVDVDYTVQDVGKDTGTITPINAESPVVAGDVWTLFRDSLISRSENFTTSGDFFAASIDEQLDNLTMIAQDRRRDADTALRKDRAIPDTLNPLIPQPVDRRTLVFQDNGGGDFEFVMSETDPDESAGFVAEAEAFRDAAETSASDASDSADAAQVSEDAASDSADDAAAAAADADGLFENSQVFNVSSLLNSTHQGFLILVDTSSGDVTITLPDSSILSGDFRVGIVKSTTDTNKAIVARSGSDTINLLTASIEQFDAFNIYTYVLRQADAAWISSASGEGGTIVQVKSFPTGAVNSSSAIIPQDDSPPQIGEGFEVMSLAFTPRKATNRLLIDVSSFGSNNNTGGAQAGVTVAIFKVGTSNALGASANAGVTAGRMVEMKCAVDILASVTTEITFKVRMGVAASPSVWTFNGAASARKFGGTGASIITIMEYIP